MHGCTILSSGISEMLTYKKRDALKKGLKTSLRLRERQTAAVKSEPRPIPAVSHEQRGVFVSEETRAAAAAVSV